MIFVEWEGEDYLKIKVKEFSYTEDMFDSSIEIVIFPNSDQTELTDYINVWSDKRIEKNIILYYDQEGKGTRYFLLKQGIPTNIIINIYGKMSNCKFRFDSMEEISRPLKIYEVLKS